MYKFPHIDFLTTAYGIMMALFLWSLWRKLRSGQIGRVLVEVGVFQLVFRLLGGTLMGAFSAVFFALVIGVGVTMAKKSLQKQFVET